ncbi:acyl-CoA thioesterase [Roseovarius sp. EL26]|uniref:acyl-CoA thioesterase n=1 Tax=Roseovarius sp. EL26 TaxID=2126672 RepID=UPI00157638AA|nr:acyl-CoA thioesterase [Roseovarius sp. EL26]
MYPFLRMIIQLIKVRNMPHIGVLDAHVSYHMCMPWDLDIWMELNNGRTLTIYDLGRIPLAVRVGLAKLLKQKRWGLTVAGSSVRYRRRIKMFEVVEMKSRGVCWDDKFFYLEQSMWKKNGECANHAMYRTAITGPNGIVPPIEVMQALGASEINPEMPVWFKAWIAAEDQRPWPPMQD